MLLCPACGEKVLKEARQCRHCSRDLSVTVELERPLNEREVYEFFKLWSPLRYDNAQLKTWQDYAAAKRDLMGNSNSPLASRLSTAQWEDLQKRFSSFPLHKTSSEPVQTSGLHHSSSKNSRSALAYAVLSATLFAGAIVFWNQSQSPQEEAALQFETTIEIPSPSPSLDEASLEPEPSPYPAPLAPLEDNRQRMEKALDATVFIRDDSSLGSGFFISSDGYILTNYHVISKMDYPKVILRNGKELIATKLREEPAKDLALLKVNVRNQTHLPLGDASKLYAGEPILTIGNPSGLSFTVTQGIVSYVGRPINGLHFIQTDSAINPGNSGGPMINQNFEVVGINTLTARVEKGISFAVPINYAYHGISQGIGRYPNNAKNFPEPASSGSPTAAESFSPDSSSPATPSAHYQREAEQLHSKRNIRIAQNQAELDRLSAEATEIQAGFSKIHQIEKQQAALKRLEQINKEMAAIQERNRAEEVQYLRQIIAILKRQQGDPAFSSQVSKIREAIRQAEAERRELESQN